MHISRLVYSSIIYFIKWISTFSDQPYVEIFFDIDLAYDTAFADTTTGEGATLFRGFVDLVCLHLYMYNHTKYTAGTLSNLETVQY